MKHVACSLTLLHSKTSISRFSEINMVASDCDKCADHEITDNV